MESLKYKDDADRSYGATGMAISLLVLDGHEMLAAISLDGNSGEMMEMTPEFYFAGNPGVSAKTAWNQLLKNYNIGVGMIISNLLCRHMVHAGELLPEEIHDYLHTLAVEEGRDACGLDEDETDRLFTKNFNYLNRVFSHRGVQAVAHDFAAALLAHRTMSRLDVLEHLDALRML